MQINTCLMLVTGHHSCTVHAQPLEHNSCGAAREEAPETKGREDEMHVAELETAPMPTVHTEQIKTRYRIEAFSRLNLVPICGDS